MAEEITSPAAPGAAPSGTDTVAALNANAAPTTTIFPSAPASAAPAPAGSAPAVSAPDSTTAPAGTVPAVTATPTADVAPAPPGDSVAAQPTEEATPFEKRLKDTQQAFHAKATEAAGYKRDLATILTHPSLGPVARRALDGIPADGTGPADPVAAALKAYREAPEDKADEAYAALRKAESEQSKREILAEIQQRDDEAETAARLYQQKVLIARTVNRLVADMAPDVPLRFFWAATQDPGTKPGAEITDPAERQIVWVQRAIALVRAELGPQLERAGRAATETAANNNGAASVMPGGGARPPAAASAGGEAKPSSFLEILAADQAGYMARR